MQERRQADVDDVEIVARQQCVIEFAMHGRGFRGHGRAGLRGQCRRAFAVAIGDHRNLEFFGEREEALDVTSADARANDAHPVAPCHA